MKPKTRKNAIMVSFKIQTIALVTRFRLQYHGSVINFNVPSGRPHVNVTCVLTCTHTSIFVSLTRARKQTLNNKQQTTNNNAFYVSSGGALNVPSRSALTLNPLSDRKYEIENMIVLPISIRN